MLQRKDMRKLIKIFLALILVILVGYGTSRLYYHVTDGFLVSNITSDYLYDTRWETRPLSQQEHTLVNAILDQKFSYLGKGCQSYVFLSADGRYVIKFFKYQRFRPQEWLDYFAFIPAVDEYRLRKIEKKRNKRESVFRSWKLAFDELQPETGLIFVHLNKTSNLNKTLTISDKMGFEHQLELDKIEFLIQRKVQPYCSYITDLMSNGNVTGAKELLSQTIALILSENARGIADNDHALMQNSGVMDGKPMHVDVGQFVRDENVKQPEVYKQQLFNKTYKFRKWLHKKYPELELYLEKELRSIIGDSFDTLKPHFIPHNEK